jgi:uncharacterized membrane protein
MGKEPDVVTEGRVSGWQPFRKAVVRGSALLAPPLFTILIFIWVITTVNYYVLEPVTGAVRGALVRAVADTRENLPLADPGDQVAYVDGLAYHRISAKTFIPKTIHDEVTASPGDTPPTTAMGYYRRYVDLKYLRPYYTVPVFLVVFFLFLYLLGRFLAAGVGRFFWNLGERFVLRVPFVRSVYASVKQVSDFVFTERELEFTRVIAVEYPRKGIWSLGFATGESLLDIRSAANEPVVSVLIPTSPIPVTGYTVTVLKSEVIDLNITIDQAVQFIVSCGVVVPPDQFAEVLQARLHDSS